MKLLDLFCGAGGAAMGYHRAGFEVVGVDFKPQPHYPFPFLEADALSFPLEGFDVIHASPPCQAYTNLQALHRHIERADLVAAVRERLRSSGRPWVIENVPGAPLLDPVSLCGTMFPGLRVYRHRRFESNVFMLQPPHPRHLIKAGGRKAQRQRKAHYLAGGFVTITGNVGSYCGPAMEIDWMNGRELSQAIPPAYTEWVGRQILAAL